MGARGSLTRSEAFALAFVGGAMGACGGGLSLVPTGPHSIHAKQIAVDEPPPPARVERVPEAPDDDCQWLDGSWQWDASGWRWIPGAWVIPPLGCYFTPSTTAWATSAEGGVLFYRQGRWYPESATKSCPEPERCEMRRVLGDEESSR
jgi:hypothetical protein